MGYLIPGLPDDDLATECLIRMHYESFPNAVLTCKKWKHEIGSPQFLRRRIMGGCSQSIVVMMQKGYDFSAENRGRDHDIIRLVVCEPKTGIWSELPHIPGYFKGFPSDCMMDVVGPNLMVFGGTHPRSLAPSNGVYIYSFISSTWRRAADMPNVRLHFEGVSHSDRAVYVIGRFLDEQNRIMMSALAYDVARDEWVRLPDVESEFVKGDWVVKATFLSGKLHVFGGVFWKPDVLKFNLCVQAFDPATSTWSPISKYLLDIGRTSYPRVEGEAGNFYVCGGGQVAVIENEKCQKVTDLPVDLHSVKDLMTWKKHLLVIGCNIDLMHTSRKTNMVCSLDLESKEWSISGASSSYSGKVLFACVTEI